MMSQVMSQMSNVSIVNVFSMLRRVNIVSEDLMGQSHQLLINVQLMTFTMIECSENSASFLRPVA